jgi:hypothetical protein
MKKLSAGFILLGFIFTLLISCKHELPAVPVINPPPGGGGGNGGGATDSICFEKDILPIFKDNCATSGCHNNLSHQKDYVLDSYENLMKNQNGIRIGEEPKKSDIYKYMLVGEHKPIQGYIQVSKETIILVKNWILDSAKNIPCGSICETSNVTYTNTIAPILKTNCYACHEGTAAAVSGIKLDTYEGVKAQGVANQLYPAISHSGTVPPMPQGRDKLSDCNIAKIKKWIDEGYRN